MTYHLTGLILSMLLAAIFGFAANRASICNVKAVEELLTVRRAYMFASFGKTVLWVIAVTIILLFLFPAHSSPGSGFAVSTAAVVGGFVCGVGMGLNGGCAFATLNWLSNGDGGMLITLGAFVVGAIGITVTDESWGMTSPISMPSPYGSSKPWLTGLFVVMLIWIVWETIRILRGWWADDRTVLELLLAKRYRLSTAAMLIGLTNGFIIFFNGPWPYTMTLVNGAQAIADAGPPPGAALWLLFAALTAGMGISSWQRGSFRLDLRPRLGWGLNFLGGLLAGAGAAVIPGGNDTLLLDAIPNLSQHAFPAYLAMVVGIAAVLAGRILTGRGIPRVDYAGEICRTP